jgi:hypothetical protein
MAICSRAPAGIAQWEFEGDLSSAVGGAPLSLGAAEPVSQPSVAFSVVSIGGVETTAALFSRGTYFRMLHGLGSGGGGRYLNRFTIIIDVLFPNRSPSGGWAALVQTDPANASDGDWFVNPAAGIGISGNYGGTVTDGEWHRLGLVVDCVAGTLTSYVNGSRVMQLQGLSLDGRFAAQEEILLFADENSENAVGYIASVQFRDEALDAGAMAGLGGPSAGGISMSEMPPPTPDGLWTFDDPGDLTKADIGQDLVLVGTQTAIAGTTAGDGAVRIGIGSYYRCAHGIPPSGGTYVNAYSMVFDFRIPAIGVWYCFFQTNQSNANDGDCFVRNSDGALGVGDTGYSSATVTPQVWHRLVVAVDNVGGRYDIYLDGEMVLDGNPQEIDGRFALDPTVLFFADDNAEDAPIDIAMLSMYGRALEPGEIERLGGPGPYDPDNRSPAVVALPAGPESVDAQTPSSFEFRASDEDGDQVQIQVDWGDGLIEGWSLPVPTGEPVAATHAFRRTGILEIWARARDEHGAISSWTRVQYIRVTGDILATILTEPYLQNVTADGISILWELDALGSCTVEYGVDETYGLSVEPEAVDTGYLSYVLRARLRGLPPATLHHYRVVVSGRATEDRTFRTAPEEAETFSFSVWGDSQGTNGGTYPADPLEPAVSMLDDMVSEGVDFGVAVGDMAENGADYAVVHRYYVDRVAGHLGRSAPWFVAWGNHDQGRSSVIRKFADSPSAERAGFDPGYGSFSFDYARCHFVCIDYYAMSGDILGWLEDDLAGAAARGVRFTFVFIHVPPYCELWIDGDAWLRANLVPMLEEYGVDACFSGHTHEYERGTLHGTSYVVTGGGSWLDFPEALITDWPHMTVGGFQSIGGGIQKGLVNEYVRVRIDGDVATLEMHAFWPDGRPRGILDSFSIDRCGNGNGPASDLNLDGIPDDCTGGGQVPGDCNHDGVLDLSDSICLLLFLFSGSPSKLPCGDGAREDPANVALLSSNGDGQIDISDAVYMLQYLFSGGPPHALGPRCRRIPGCPQQCGP